MSSENSTSNSYTGRPANEMSLLMGSTSEQGDVTTTYRLRMWVDEDYNPQGDTGGKTFAVEVNVYGKQGEPFSKAVRTLLTKANDASITDYEDGNKGEMYTFTHEAGEQQSGWTKDELTDYRYIGVDPNNYVSFNDETWRIIGVFTVEDEDGNKRQRVKIIRANSIGEYSWDNQVPVKKDWQEARLMKLLNPGYENESVGGSLYYTSGSGNCYSGMGNATVSCNFADTGLGSEAQSMIANVKWYLGNTVSTQNAPAIYQDERNTQNSNWIGKVGLLYLSDYVYTFAYGVNEACYTNPNSHDCENMTESDGVDASYLYDYDDDFTGKWVLQSGIYVTRYVTNTMAYSSRNVYPVLYLASNVSITDGTGTSSDPYILQME